LIILSHSGKQHSYHVAKAMYQLELLERFYTSSYVTSSFLQRMAESQIQSILSRRFVSGLPGILVDSNWRFEIPEILIRKMFGKGLATQRAVYRRDVNFDKFVAKQIIKLNRTTQIESPLFWGFQGSSYTSVSTANQLGWTSVCELATAHVVSAKKILGEEARLNPEWAKSIDNLVFPAQYEKRLEEEPLVAKKVIAASSFTKNSLLEVGVKDENIILLPLGFDAESISYHEENFSSPTDRPLRLLFAGTVTQRKGIKYLLEALKKLNAGKDVELHIIGGIQGPVDPLKKYSGLYFYHGPMSQTELFGKYEEFDALVLPTVFEGFGLVILEAMAAGLPVITTPHSIGPELISNGKNGYVVPIRDVEKLEAAISLLLNKSGVEYLQMRKEARKEAMHFSWSNYTNSLSNILKSGVLY
jgi:alpha-maltose-1-phosphate synthase